MKNSNFDKFNLIDWNAVITAIQNTEKLKLTEISARIGINRNGCAQIRNFHTNPRFSTGAALISWYMQSCSRYIPLLNGQRCELFK